MNLKQLYYRFPVFFQNYINKLASKFTSTLEENFVNSNLGKNFGLEKNDRIYILKKLKNALINVESATDLSSHLLLIQKIFESKKKYSNSYVVECGTYFGASAIPLSIACKITKKKLIIYDSFEGLPNSEKEIGKRYYPHLKVTGNYKKGMYKCSLENVKKNIFKYGELDVCEFRKGLFSKTLIKHKELIDFLFIDVDLVSSTRECIKYLWPYIRDNAYVYTDDACDMDVVKVWFDEKWWKKNLNCKAPGFVGSGCGLPVNLNFSSLGYTIKNPNKFSYEKVFWLK